MWNVQSAIPGNRPVSLETATQRLARLEPRAENVQEQHKLWRPVIERALLADGLVPKFEKVPVNSHFQYVLREAWRLIRYLKGIRTVYRSQLIAEKNRRYNLALKTSRVREFFESLVGPEEFQNKLHLERTSAERQLEIRSMQSHDTNVAQIPDSRRTKRQAQEAEHVERQRTWQVRLLLQDSWHDNVKSIQPQHVVPGWEMRVDGTVPEIPDLYWLRRADGLMKFCQAVAEHGFQTRLDAFDVADGDQEQQQAAQVAVEIYQNAFQGSANRFDIASQLKSVCEECDHDFHVACDLMIRLKIPEFLTDGPADVETTRAPRPIESGDAERSDAAETGSGPSTPNKKRGNPWKDGPPPQHEDWFGPYEGALSQIQDCLQRGSIPTLKSHNGNTYWIQKINDSVFRLWVDRESQGKVIEECLAQHHES